MEQDAPANPNDAVLRALFSELDRLGVREFCVAAGARNSPIIAALLGRGSEWYCIRHFFDERSAGFFALGRIMASAAPVAVVTTSGTAAAELLPAMMESHYHGLRLIAITADRPAAYRRTGAPQAVEQPGIYGAYASRCWEGKWLLPEDREMNLGEALAQPIHFNVCLEECAPSPIPFMAPENEASQFRRLEEVRRTSVAAAWEGSEAKAFWQMPGPLAVLVAGLQPDRDVGPVREFLLKLGAPIVAEATSNLQNDEALHALLVAGGEKALRALNPRRVLRIGAVPSWRWWRDLEERDEVAVLNVAHVPFRGLARTQGVTEAPMADLANFDVTPRAQAMAKLEDRGADIVARLNTLLSAYPNSEPAWVRALSRVIPAGATVFLGNSLPIREWNLAADVPQSGTRFFANRGANGIDGLISTGLGVGAETEEAWIVVGDLSALYDMNALWILPQLKNRKWRIVVINNAGGKIFSRVGWLRALPDKVREVVENRHAMNFEPWARLWGLAYRYFDEAAHLCDDDTAAAVWEIVPDPVQTEAFWEAWK